MSWDKNTINNSEIDTIISILKDLEITFILTPIDTFWGRGLNDNFCEDEPEQTHELRELKFRNFIVLEYVEQDADCDTDDVIMSQKFTSENAPRAWQTIRWTDKNSTQEDDWVEKQNKEYGVFITR